MQKLLSQVQTLLNIPLTVGIFCIPFLAILIVILLLAGSGGSLNDSCEPSTIQAQALAVLAPNRFWKEQLDYLDKRAAMPFTPPSIWFTQESSKLTAQIAAVSPNVARTQTEPERQIDSLRQAADKIEHQEWLRRLDANALANAIAERNRTSACISHVKKLLLSTY
jgi:hypothetical protein